MLDEELFLEKMKTFTDNGFYFKFIYDGFNCTCLPFWNGKAIYSGVGKEFPPIKILSTGHKGASTLAMVKLVFLSLIKT